MRAALLTSTLLTALLLAGACVQPEPVVLDDIVSTIPWPDEERAEYVLLDRDSGDEEGSGVLSVTRKDGEFELRLRFEGEGDFASAARQAAYAIILRESKSKEIGDLRSELKRYAMSSSGV